MYGNIAAYQMIPLRRILLVNERETGCYFVGSVSKIM